MDRTELNQEIQNFKRITGEGEITPASLGTLLAGISDTIASEVEAGKPDYILDLGVVASAAKAYELAAANAVVSNPKIRMIVWRTSDSSTDGGRGDGGVIFQSRTGNWYVSQLVIADGANCQPMYRNITTGGNYSCGAWQSFLLPASLDVHEGFLYLHGAGRNSNSLSVRLPITPQLAVPTAQSEVDGSSNNYIYSVNDKNSQIAVLTCAHTGIVNNGDGLGFRRGIYNPTSQSGVYYTDSIPTATSSRSALMHKNDKAKLDALPTATDLTTSLAGKVDKVSGKGLSTHDFNNQWLTRLSNAGVYSRSQANLNKSFNASSNVFALSKTSTQSDITSALTDYESGNVLTAEDFDYCFANGCKIYNGATQGFVQVTANGGGFYNLIEISFTNYTMLPKMRFICLRALDDGTWQVMRNGQEERICYYTELQALTARVAALEAK